MRSVKIKEVIDALERFAPLPLQESYDNSGLQVGLTEVEVSGALLCLDVTDEVIDEALSLGCNLIIAHHPLIFNKLSQVTEHNYIQRLVIRLIKSDITLVAMHTNIDAAMGGVNYKIAEKLQLSDVAFFGKKKSVCIENAMVEGGEGVIGTLPEPLNVKEFVAMLKGVFAAECVQTNQELDRPIRTVALCGGSGAFLIKDAISAGADAFVTGEMHYHDFFGNDGVIQLCSVGHFESEQYTNEVFKSIIEKECKGVVCHLTKVNTNPIKYW